MCGLGYFLGRDTSDINGLTVVEAKVLPRREQPTTITEYDEQLIRRLIEKVTIYEDKFTVEFKSGVMVAVNI